jgi:hypothetical protein
MFKLEPPKSSNTSLSNDKFLNHILHKYSFIPLTFKLVNDIIQFWSNQKQKISIQCAANDFCHCKQNVRLSLYTC